MWSAKEKKGSSEDDNILIYYSLIIFSPTKMITTTRLVNIHHYTVDSLHPLHPSPLITTNLLSLSMSLFFCLFICFFRFHIWEKSYGIVFLHLTYFTKHNTFKVNPYCHKWQDFTHFYSWLIFHCTYIPHLLYLFIHWWTLRLFPYLDYSE